MFSFSRTNILFLNSALHRAIQFNKMNFLSSLHHGSSPTKKGTKKLIRILKEEGVITSKEVEQAFLEVDRGDFCTYDPYSDHASPIGFNATISAPHMHGIALELLKDKLINGKKALDIGSGSGYLTAAFAVLMKDPEAKVYGVEHIKDLVDLSLKNIAKNHKDLLDSGKVTIIQGDGRLGLPGHGLFDAIHVGAGSEAVPKELLDQLANGGRMVIPVGKRHYQKLTVIDKQEDGKITETKSFPVMFVPLTSQEKQSQNEPLFSFFLKDFNDL